MSNFFETYHLQQFGKTLHPPSEPMSDQPQIKSNRIIGIGPPIKATTHLSQNSPTPLYAKANQQATTSPNFQRITPTTTGLKPQSLETTIPTQARHLDDTTIATLTSTASTTLNSSYQATRFAELESAIKANQHAFKNMNNNYKTMENRVMETMEACHENSKQLITMQNQMTNMQVTMQAIADQMSSSHRTH
jgi:hypothetical protein